MKFNESIKRFLLLNLISGLSLFSWNQILSQQITHIQEYGMYNGHVQEINILIIDKQDLDSISIDLVFSDTLKKTSVFANENNALAAINAGFFDVKNGNSVSFIEHMDTLVQSTLSKSDFLKGSLIFEKEGDLILQAALSDSIYLDSKKEKSILGTGPVLILNGYKLEIPVKSFSKNRHPRSCICENEKNIMFFVIDGRSTEAHGMNLYELQEYLLNKGCKDAINLDGGGSSTLWIQGKGIVNTPSDKSGERKVANVIVISEKL